MHCDTMRGRKDAQRALNKKCPYCSTSLLTVAVHQSLMEKRASSSVALNRSFWTFFRM